MSVIWISFAKISKYKIRFEEFLKRKIYIEYVINLLGVVCKSVVLFNVQIFSNDIFLKHPIFTLIKTIHNICMYIIITYGTLYCFSNNLYRGGHCIDNIMTLSDEMFENSMRQGNNNEELLHFSNWYYVFVYIFFFNWNLFLSHSVTLKVVFHSSDFIYRQDLALQKCVSFKTQFNVKMMFNRIDRGKYQS